MKAFKDKVVVITGAGQVSALIKEIKPVKEIIKEIVS